MSAVALRQELGAHLQEGRPDRALDRIIAVLGAETGDLALKWTAHSLLQPVVERMPSSAFDSGRARAVRARSLPMPPVRRPTGRVAMPTVRGDLARFVEVHVRAWDLREEDEISPAGLSAETRAAVTEALDAARLVLKRQTQRFHVQIETPVEGPSCGLAVALAAISDVNRLPVGDDLAATGAVSEDGRVIAVGHLADKLRLRRQARPGARLLCPAGQEDPQDSQVRPVASLLDALHFIGAGPAMDIAHEINVVRGDFGCGRWPEAAERARTLLSSEVLHGEERLELLTVLLAAANHRGDQEEAARLAAELRPLLSAWFHDPRQYAQTLAHLAIQAVDRFRPDLADEVLDLARELHLPEQDPGWLHVRGARAMAAVLRGDLDRALDLRRHNAGFAASDERPRCLIDLADVHLRRGELDQAADALEGARVGLEHSSARRRDYILRTRRYLHFCAARLDRARGDVKSARAHLDQAAEAPELRLRVGLERALLHPEQAGRVQAIDRAFGEALDGARAAEPIFQALRLRALVWAGDQTARAALAACMGLDGAGDPCDRLPY